MEIVVLIAVINVAIMCWLFCVVYSFSFMEEEKDNISNTLFKAILAIFVGWIVTPIILGFKISNLI